MFPILLVTYMLTESVLLEKLMIYYSSSHPQRANVSVDCTLFSKIHIPTIKKRKTLKVQITNAIPMNHMKAKIDKLSETLIPFSGTSRSYFYSFVIELQTEVTNPLFHFILLLQKKKK